MALINCLLYLILFLISLLISFLAVETLSAILLKEKNRQISGKRPRITVIIPAHNEETVIASTIVSIRSQLSRNDKILVIADNCNDDTAQVALGLGVEVLERHDLLHTGKGHALDHGISAIQTAPPDVIVFMDADIIATQGSLEKISRLAFETGQPVQACYLLKPPNGSGAKSQLSAFAFCFKNYIRPFGLLKLGLPCLLTGTGMAIPWTLIQTISLASGNIVEDMQLGIDLSIAGYRPQFCPSALITGDLPATPDTAIIQRKRWEYGHIKTILTQVPKLLSHSIKYHRIDLLGLSMELLIPPLSILFFLWLMVMVILIVFSLFNLVTWDLVIGSAGLGFVLGLTIFLGWLNFARDILSFRILLKTPLYVFSKLPIYLSFIKYPEKKWIKTKREKIPSDSECKKNTPSIKK